MTDNEIIKALDVCGHTKGCTNCPLEKSDPDNCCIVLTEGAIDLINRLQEELNQYAEEHRNLMAKIEKKDKDIEKWQQLNFDLCTAGGKLLHERKTIRAEAYKELLNLLEGRLVGKTKITAFGYEIAIIEIKNHLKEMVGEDK